MRPYSLDLRERAVALYEKLGVYLQVAKQLQVHPTWVKNMVEKKRLTGSLENECARRGRHACIDEPGRLLLRRWLDEENDLTLETMLDRLRRKGYRCCRATVANALAAMGITRKKNDVRGRAKPSGRQGEAGALVQRNRRRHSRTKAGLSR